MSVTLVIALFFLNIFKQGSDGLFSDINFIPKNTHIVYATQNSKNKNNNLEYKNNLAIPEGLKMFRGNMTRNWYGKGPVPSNLQTIWKYPNTPMCSESSVYGKTTKWCGNGWTGEPVVWERPDGITEVIFGAYDRAVHFVNAETGKDTRPPFMTGDLIKGSVTLDPDGYPLLYFGSRDNYLRILSLENESVAKEIWKFSSLEDKGMWNNDWDSNPVIIGDIMYEGCENGYFYVFKLNKKIDADGNVSVNPVQLFKSPVYTDELIKNTDSMQSIESSILILNNVAYMTNSGGRMVGFDISKVESGVAPVVFDFWLGDDTDATPVADEDGNIYVAIEKERFNARSKQIGQLVKINPKDNVNPIVWSLQIPGVTEKSIGGIWATPVIYKKHLYVSTHKGDLINVNTDTGKIVWKENIGEHEWGSASVVDDKLIVPLCKEGGVATYDLANPEIPKFIEKLKVGGCVESAPAVWKGQIFFGSRDGYFYKLGESAISNL